jgi:uncharacterized protein YutE (UPF0331/DUF86 family)
MIDKTFINHKIELLLEDIALLKRVESKTFEELARDDQFLWNGVQHILQKIIGRGIDINQHLIAELSTEKTNTPLDYTETFLILTRLHVLPKKFAEEIARSAGFRNAIVHEYNHLNEGLVYKSVGEAIKQYTTYCDHIITFIEGTSE